MWLEPWGVGGVVQSFQVGSGGGEVGNGVVDPPKLGVFAIGRIPVLLLNVNLNSGTQLWWEICNDRTIEKYSSVLKDELLEDSSGLSVLAASTAAVTLLL